MPSKAEISGIEVTMSLEKYEYLKEAAQARKTARITLAGDLLRIIEEEGFNPSMGATNNAADVLKYVVQGLRGVVNGE